MKKIVYLLLIFFLSIDMFAFDLHKEALKHKQKAEQYYQKQDWENAVKEYRQVLSYAPEVEPDITEHFIIAQLNLALTYFEKDNDKAFKLLKDLMYQHPKFGLTYYYLGKLNEMNKSYDDAEKYYKEFLNIDKGNKFHDEVKNKLKSWNADKEAYKLGVQFMAKGDFALAYEEFKKISVINKDKANNFISKISNILNDSSSTNTTTQTIETSSVQTLLKTFENAIETKNIELLSSIIDNNFISSIGDKTAFINYYKNFWFSLFTGLKFSCSNVQQIKIDEKQLQITFDYTLEGIYNGKNMLLNNKLFNFGNTYSLKGKMSFLLNKKDGSWLIVN